MARSNNEGYLVSDPARAAETGIQTFNDQLNTGAGGGLIAGAGTYYSQPTQIDQIQDVGDLVNFTGALVGTLTLEVGNGDDHMDRLGQTLYTTYTPLSGNGFTSGVAAVSSTITGGSNPQGIQVHPSFSRIRWKFVVASGAGTWSVRRMVRGV